VSARGTDPTLVVFTGLLLATGALRWVELRVSSRRIRAQREAPLAEPWLFPLMAAVHAALVVGPPLEVVGLERPFVPALAAGADRDREASSPVGPTPGSATPTTWR
jgi:hypothetical protein